LKKIIVVSSDTPHHRYFINFLLKQGIHLTGCFFENNPVLPGFATGPLFEEEEKEFEETHFFVEMNKDLPTSLISQVSTVNSPQSLETLKELRPDLGIVFGTGKINLNIINLFKSGLINVHRGISQEYRGLDSDLWAIYHSDYDNLGVTIHKVDPTLDTGDIVYQEKLELRKGMEIHQIRYYTTLIATHLVIKAVSDYLNHRMDFRPQEKRGRYYSFMPLKLKKIARLKFNKYCSDIHE
jgi:methionyl-tRNA formyltransferase|tara:strand:+ start:1914 stop:2630 length:717 start_codon:yes stop_codon:yes gene_type:complete